MAGTDEMFLYCENFVIPGLVIAGFDCSPFFSVNFRLVRYVLVPASNPSFIKIHRLLMFKQVFSKRQSI